MPDPTRIVLEQSDLRAAQQQGLIADNTVDPLWRFLAERAAPAGKRAHEAPRFSFRPTRSRRSAAASRAALSRARSRQASNERARIDGSATTRLSSAESSLNRLMAWNDRAIPSRVIAGGGRPRIDRPSNAMSPRSGV